jgi:hypothetical protein
MGNFNYYNLILSGAGVKTPVAGIDVDGLFTLASGTSFSAGGYTHTFAGNWINNGATFTYGGSTISLDGAAQTIGGTTPTTFGNLTLAGTNTKVFGLSTTVDGLLSIGTGVVANLGTFLTHTSKALSLNAVGQGPGTWGSNGSTATNRTDVYFTSTSPGILTVEGRAFFSRQTGLWNANTTWSSNTYGGAAAAAGLFPGAADVVSIGGGDFVVTVNVNSNCFSLNFQPNTGNSPTVTLNTGITLNVGGAINIPSAGGLFSGDDNTLNVGAGILNAGSMEFSTGGILGSGHVLRITSGTATITGDVTQGFPNATITFAGSGTLRVGGAFLNSSNCDFTPSTGTVEYFGSTVAQSIGDFTYYNLILNNTFGTMPQLSLIDDTPVTNALTMTSGVVNMNGNTLTLGLSGAASTLTRTASTTTNWMYGGSFTRFWPTGQTPSPTAGNLYGLFPLGHSVASSYRPLAITAASNITTTGSITYTHTNATGVTDLSPVYNDGGTNIVRKHNSQFVVGTTGLGGGGSFTVSAANTHLPAGTASDIRLAVSNGAQTVTAVGTHVANSGTAQNPTVGRSGVPLANLAGDYRITTINLTNTPLPIELLYFRARVDGETVTTEWATASEINNHFFTVQKTINFETFYDAGEIDGQGNSRDMHSYNFTDMFPISGKSYYRLKQTDFDGNVSYSPPVMINFENTSDPVLSVYPNPSAGNITILISGLPAETDVPVQIYNLLGEKVYEAVLTQEAPGFIRTNIEFGGTLPRGHYIVKAGKTLQLTRKLSIN